MRATGAQPRTSPHLLELVVTGTRHSHTGGNNARRGPKIGKAWLDAWPGVGNGNSNRGGVTPTNEQQFLASSPSFFFPCSLATPPSPLDSGGQVDLKEVFTRLATT